MLGEIFGLGVLVLLVYSLVDIIMSEDDAPHGLPKLMWLLMVLLLPLAGSIVWLIVSRRARAAARSIAREQRPRSGHPEYERPGPETDEEFRRRLRRRAEEQRRKAAGENPDP